MALDKATVARMAGLARIRLDPDEETRLAGELTKILGWIEQLNEVDTSGIAPMASVVQQQLPMREDVVTDGACREQILANAPQQESGFFAVPKVVE